MSEGVQIPNAPVRMSGGRALAEMIKLYEPGPMFGMGGFQLLPFYDAVRALGLRHNLINDERAGVFAADAWARVTGRPGICDATLGPGATNLVTGLVESLNAGVPLVVLTGNTNRDYASRHMTQEARQVDILRPAAKEVIRIEQGSRIPEHVRRAFALATSGRPGPVVIDVPEDVCHETFDYDPDAFDADAATRRVPARRIRPATEAVEAAAKLIDQAARPIVLAGGGVHLSDGAAALSAFTERFQIPVAHTLSGKGAIACTHPLAAGLFGRYSRIANDLIEESDLVIALGCKLGEIATRRYQLPRPSVPLIQIDILAEEIGRWAPVAAGLWADARAALADLSAALDEKAATRRDAYGRSVAERMTTWRNEAMARYQTDETPVNMARLIYELQRVWPEDGILLADGGFAAHWTGLLFDTVRPGRRFIANRGFASIGYGLPGTIGAALAADGSPVVGLTGDGGLNMSIGELETARRLGLDVVVIVVNNAASGYVKALQHTMFEGRYQSSDLSETNYAEVARSLGCRGIRVERPDELAEAFRDGIGGGGVAVVDVVVTRDPAKMLPGVDTRSVKVEKGDRIV